MGNVIRYLRVCRLIHRHNLTMGRSYYGSFDPIVSTTAEDAAGSIFACQFINFGNTRIVPCTVAVLPTVKNGKTWKPRR